MDHGEKTHTPGPWKPHATELNRSYTTEYEIWWSDDGECVAEIVHGKANAHLIAAAPDLLEAIKEANPIVHNLCGLDGEPDPELQRVKRLLRKAIAKADGKG